MRAPPGCESWNREMRTAPCSHRPRPRMSPTNHPGTIASPMPARWRCEPGRGTTRSVSAVGPPCHAGRADGAPRQARHRRVRAGVEPRAMDVRVVRPRVGSRRLVRPCDESGAGPFAASRAGAGSRSSPVARLGAPREWLVAPDGGRSRVPPDSWRESPPGQAHERRQDAPRGRRTWSACGRRSARPCRPAPERIRPFRLH